MRGSVEEALKECGEGGGRGRCDGRRRRGQVGLESGECGQREAGNWWAARDLAGRAASRAGAAAEDLVGRGYGSEGEGCWLAGAMGVAARGPSCGAQQPNRPAYRPPPGHQSGRSQQAARTRGIAVGRTSAGRRAAFAGKESLAVSRAGQSHREAGAAETVTQAPATPSTCVRTSTPSSDAAWNTPSCAPSSSGRSTCSAMGWENSRAGTRR